MIVFFVGFDDGGGVDAGGGAEGVAADDRVIRRNGGVRGFGDGFGLFFELGEVVIDQAEEFQIDQH